MGLSGLKSWKLAKVCRYSTAGSSPLPPTRSSAPLIAFAVGSVVSGFIGYKFANSQPSDVSPSKPANSPSGLNEHYGSPEDFRKAISELKAVFPEEDIVSTDEDVLEVHGNSDNDYHPGIHNAVT